MPEERLLEKVKKLLALSKSDNLNEASVAAAAAAKLMAEHQIDEMMLAEVVEADDPDEPIEDGLLYTKGQSKIARWAGQLAVQVCRVNTCKCFRLGGELRIIGRPKDAQTARYFYSYLVTEIERLAEQEGALRGRPGRTWFNNFKEGAVQAVSVRLREGLVEARKEARQHAVQNDELGTGAALVRVNDALVKIEARKQAVEEFSKMLGIRKGRRTATTYDREARKAGRRAGQSINLHSGKPLGTGSRGALKA